jgi:hypothetical protein
MKSKLSILLTTLLCTIGMAGCALFQSPVPTTKIKGSIGGQSFSLENPKNTTLSNLSVTVSSNGSAALTIGSVTSVNDSNVIDAAYAGQAAIVAATGTAINAGIQTAAGAAGVFAGAAAKAP